MLRLALTLSLLAFITLAPSTTGLAQAGEDKATTKESRRSEGEQLLKSLRDRARVAFAKTGAAPRTLTGTAENSGCGATTEELAGKYFTAKDKLYDAGNDKFALIADPKTAEDGICLLKFNMAKGDATISWHDSLDALKKANGDITFEADKSKATGTGEVAKDDPYALYKKKGRSWVHKSTTTIPGMDPMVTHMKYEVTEVADGYATYKLWILDKDQKPMAGMPEPTPTKIEFMKATPPAGRDVPKIETKEETIEVTAGKFECIVTEVSGTKVWSSKKYPGLLVKMDAASTTMELIEFKD